MSVKKKERAATKSDQIDAEPKATEKEETQSMGRFFLLVFGIPFIIIIAIGVLAALTD